MNDAPIPAAGGGNGALPPPAAARQAYLALAACLPLALAWTLYAGKDLSWDLLNHHLYLPWAWLNGHHAQDLFAAGPQSYLSPVGYLPMVLLARSGVPDIVAAIALSALHALPVWPLWRIAQALWPAGPDALWWRRVALALALAAPSYLLVAGTSSADPLGATGVLLALERAVRHAPRLVDALWAGVAMGVAMAIKPTNAIFLAALLAVWPWRTGGLRQAVGLLGAATMLVLALHGPWSWMLWQRFGNPVFPLFNQFFQSPYAPVEATSASRFLPDGWVDALLRPWVIAQPQRLTHTEALAPDLRPLLAALAGLALLPLWAWRRRTSVSSAAPVACETARVDRQLLLFGLIGWVGWLFTSANSRYALPLFLLVGVLLVRALNRLLPRGAARVAVGLALVLQVLYYGELGNRRFDTPVSWGQRSYLTVDMPARLVDQPFLYLSLGTPSYAAVVPELHPQSVFVNAISTLSIPMDGPLGDQMRKRLSGWQGRTRILLRGVEPRGDSPEARQTRRAHDRTIERFGLRVDWRDCTGIVIHTPPHGTPLVAVPAQRLLTCAAQPLEHADPAYDQERLRAERAFEAIERACPRVFGPRPLVTDASLAGWHRHYVNTDARVTVSAAEGVSLSYFGAWGARSLGSLDDVAVGRGADPCVAWRELITR